MGKCSSWYLHSVKKIPGVVFYFIGIFTTEAVGYERGRRRRPRESVLLTNEASGRGGGGLLAPRGEQKGSGEVPQRGGGQSRSEAGL